MEDLVYFKSIEFGEIMFGTPDIESGDIILAGEELESFLAYQAQEVKKQYPRD